MEKQKSALTTAQKDKLIEYYDQGNYEEFNNYMLRIIPDFYIEDVAEEIGTSGARVEQFEHCVRAGIREFSALTVTDPKRLKLDRTLAERNSKYLGCEGGNFEFVDLGYHIKSDLKKLSVYSKQFATGNELALIKRGGGKEEEWDGAIYCADEKELTQKLITLHDLNFNPHL